MNLATNLWQRFEKTCHELLLGNHQSLWTIFDCPPPSTSYFFFVRWSWQVEEHRSDFMAWSCKAFWGAPVGQKLIARSLWSGFGSVEMKCKYMKQTCVLVHIKWFSVFDTENFSNSAVIFVVCFLLQSIKWMKINGCNHLVRSKVLLILSGRINRHLTS